MFLRTIVLRAIACAALFVAVHGCAVAQQPLVLTGTIPLPNVQGRIDHFGFDPKGRLFVSALGNNTEEVIDISAGRVAHSIGGIPKPQGVAYSPEVSKLFVGVMKANFISMMVSPLTSSPRSILGTTLTIFATTEPASVCTLATAMPNQAQLE